MTLAPSVLIVDDDDITVLIMRRVLERAGLASDRVAHDGIDALREIENGPPPDLILLDINMPRMDGFEFLRHYGSLPAASRERTTLVMITTSTLDSDRDRALADPAVTAVLEKPLTSQHADWLREVVDVAPPRRTD